ncbi:MAG: carbon storage regulator [Planctomycetaceae bacterium]|nr:carbon storage regulator [Planctomycetaceae bacterium]
MLVLSRKAGESVFIGHDVSITIVKVTGRQVKLKIDAPRDIPILREELCSQEIDFELDLDEVAVGVESAP